MKFLCRDHNTHPWTDTYHETYEEALTMAKNKGAINPEAWVVPHVNDYKTTNKGESMNTLKQVLKEKGLTLRESEAVELVSKGLSNKEIANMMFLTEKTVKFHLTNTYKKIGVKSRAQLIVFTMPYTFEKLAEVQS